MDDITIVGCLLRKAGVDASGDEVERLAQSYPVLAGAVAMLYTVEEARYELTAMRFIADPEFADWPPGSKARW